MAGEVGETFHWVIALLAGLALAALGQWSMMTGRSALGLRPEWGQALRPVWLEPGPVVTAIGLFLAALVCCVVSLQLRPGGRWHAAAARRWSAGRRVDPVAPVCLISGALLFVWVLVQLGTRPYQPSYPRWYLLSLALLLAGLLWRERGRLGLDRRRRPTAAHLLESGLVLALVGVFLWLATFDLREWRFASIGDEHPFHDFARRVAKGGEIVNLFSDRGVYDKHPVLSSYVTGTLMRLLGTDLVGWKVATNLPLALALVFVFLFARTLYGRAVGFLTLGMLVTAHYLLAFAHTGYNNLEPLLGTAAALYLFVVARRRYSPALLALSGAMAGLGWYTFFSGRTTIAMLGLAVLLTLPRRRWLASGIAIGAGFAVLVLPMVVVNGRGMYDRMRLESSANPEGPPRSDIVRLLVNSGRSLLAFNYNTHVSHYVSGSLAEPVTAVLFVVGLGLALASWRDHRSRLVLIWLGVGVAATGIVSRYDHVTITRMSFALPAVALLAAVAAERIIAAGLLLVGPRWRSTAGAGALALVVGLVAIGNVHRFYVVTPRQAPTGPVSVMMRILQEPACEDAALPPVMLTRDGDHVLVAVIAQNGRVESPEIVRYTDPTGWIETAPDRCVVFASPWEVESEPFKSELAARWPAQTATEETDGTGQIRLLVWYPPRP